MMLSVYLFIVYYVVSILLLIGKCDFAFPCITWDDNTGVCVDADSCTGFREALNKSYSFVNDLWINSQCYENDPKTICCGFAGGKLYFTFDLEKSPIVSSTTVPSKTPDVSYRDIADQYNHVVKTARLFLPDRCGKDQAGNRLIDRTRTSTVEPDEFTWLAHIIPKKSTDALCTGILINALFVLTSYSCGFNAEKVRLGVYRLNETTTCVVTSPTDDFLDCRVSVQEKEVDFISDPNNIPEVGILKIKGGIGFSDYIRAICLPFEENVKPQVNQDMFVSGWNLFDNEGTNNSKQKLLYRLARKDQCHHSAFSSNLDEEKSFCLVAGHNLTVNAGFAESTEPIVYQYSDGKFYLAGFRWLTIPSSENSNKQILGSTITLRTLKWILDQTQLLIKK